MCLLLNLSPEQQVFMLFYSILYGVMLSGMTGISPFPVTAVFVSDYRQSKRLWRLLLSVIVLNILPIVFFAGALLGIGIVYSGGSFLKFVFAAILSLTVFGWQNLWFFLALCRCDKEPVFYTKGEYERWLIEERGFKRRSYCLVAALTYFALFLLLLPSCWLHRALTPLNITVSAETIDLARAGITIGVIMIPVLGSRLRAHSPRNSGQPSKG